jgi:hypothetical protein
MAEANRIRPHAATCASRVLFASHACDFLVRSLEHQRSTMTQDPLLKPTTSPQCSLTHQCILSSMLSFACPQCNKRCKSLSGLTRHQNSTHKDDPGLSVPVAELQRIYHPSLNGTYNPLDITLFSFSEGRRCDGDGTFLTPNTPPELPTVKANDDWSPFTSRAGFELAEFLFSEAELSQKKVDKLLELWAATLVPHGDTPPIANHQHLHQQIDAIELGDVKWENASLKYDGPLPETTRPPEWKTAEYDIWFRDPRKVIKNILANPDFNGHIDYMAYQEFDGEKRRYSNMMSGDWSWEQSVRFADSIFLPTLRTLLLGYHCPGHSNSWLHVCPGHPRVR